FCVVANSAAVACPVVPVAGCDIVVGTGHFDAAFAGDGSDCSRCGREDGVWPVRIRLHLEICFFDCRDWRVIAAVEPDKKAGVMTKAEHLRTKRIGGDSEILRRPVLPVLPMIAAAPAKHDQNAALIGEAEEAFGFELTLEPDGVEVHVLHEVELIAQPVFVCAEEHVLRPTGAADENGLAIHAEEAAAICGELGSNFTNAEADALFIRGAALYGEADGEAFKVRVAHLARPPELWTLYSESRELLGAEDDCLIFVCCELDGLFELYASGSAGDDAFDWAIRRVVKFCVDGDIRAGERAIRKMGDR